MNKIEVTDSRNIYKKIEEEKVTIFFIFIPRYFFIIFILRLTFCYCCQYLLFPNQFNNWSIKL